MAKIDLKLLRRPLAVRGLPVEKLGLPAGGLALCNRLHIRTIGQLPDQDNLPEFLGVAPGQMEMTLRQLAVDERLPALARDPELADCRLPLKPGKSYRYVRALLDSYPDGDLVVRHFGLDGRPAESFQTMAARLGLSAAPVFARFRTVLRHLFQAAQSDQTFLFRPLRQMIEQLADLPWPTVKRAKAGQRRALVLATGWQGPLKYQGLADLLWYLTEHREELADDPPSRTVRIKPRQTVEWQGIRYTYAKHSPYPELELVLREKEIEVYDGRPGQDRKLLGRLRLEEEFRLAEYPLKDRAEVLKIRRPLDAGGIPYPVKPRSSFKLERAFELLRPGQLRPGQAVTLFGTKIVFETGAQGQDDWEYLYLRPGRNILTVYGFRQQAYHLALVVDTERLVLKPRFNLASYVPGPAVLSDYFLPGGRVTVFGAAYRLPETWAGQPVKGWRIRAEADQLLFYAVSGTSPERALPVPLTPPRQNLSVRPPLSLEPGPDGVYDLNGLTDDREVLRVGPGEVFRLLGRPFYLKRTGQDGFYILRRLSTESYQVTLEMPPARYDLGTVRLKRSGGKTCFIDRHGSIYPDYGLTTNLTNFLSKPNFQ